MLGVGLVVLGVSVPVPPAAPELMPEELPDELPLGSAGMDDEPELELPPIEEPLLEPEGMELLPEVPEELPPDERPPSEGIDELPPELPLLPLLLEPLPELLPEPPPVMPEHATMSIAQATDIIHLIIDHSR